MASSSNRAESSPSSSSVPPQFCYDVFLSFRSEDARDNFTDHLYAALVRRGLFTFKSDNKLDRGGEIGPQLLKSIEQSKISVTVFSRKYADSRWCLDELVKIIECKRTFKQIVLPVFYDVDPSDVRAQRGCFAQAFARHEERCKGGGGMEGKVKRWRSALTEAANLSGYDLRNIATGYKPKVIEKIVADISKKLDFQYLNVANYPVGLESRVQRVKKMLSLGSKDVRIIGIWGIGGIGKTTIAKAIYNQIRLQFEGTSFLANVRDISKQPSGLVALQEQLLSDILTDESRNIINVDWGIEVIKQRLWCRRVLVILDDVDDVDQLKALAIRHDWFHSGSRIIVTTRDHSLLNLLEVDGVYMPELLDFDEALQVFSWHAFRKAYPIEHYMELSRKVVGYARGLPLVLVVLGSFLFDKIMPQWKSALEKLNVIPHDDIQEKLRISFDSLSEEQKDLFLDIACFFVGMDQNYTIKILERYDFFPEIELAVLSRRSLVTIESGRLVMHNMLRDMGREIVRREHREEPGKRSRLWFHEDVLDVLTSYKGTEAVEGLVLNLPKSNEVKVDAQAFATMNRLRLLQLNYVRLNGSYEHLFKRLRWLCWIGFPLKFVPSNLFIENVVAIDMRYSSLKQVWKGRKVLCNLKFLDLSHSYYLTKTPDFSGVTNLERLLLKDCVRLVEVHQSIECLEKLVVLDMSNCKNLWKLPLGIHKLTSLQDLSLSGCSRLATLPGFKGSPSKSWFSILSPQASLGRNHDSINLSPSSTQGLISLTRLNMANCNFSYVPDELGSLISLQYLNLSGNKNLRELTLGICKLTSLQYLVLSLCPKLENLSGFKGSSSKSPFSPFSSEASPVRNPDCTSLVSAQGLISLRGLFIKDCNLSHIPYDLGSSISLQDLTLSGNKNLRELPQGIWKLKYLRNLSLSGCSKLEKLPGLQGSPSKSLVSIFSSQSSPLRNSSFISLSPASMQGLISITELDLAYCNFSYLPNEVGSLVSLRNLDLRGNNFCTLPASISCLCQLWTLNLSHCTRLQSLPELPANLGAVIAKNCTSLERISIGSDFQNSPSLSFFCCHSLKTERSLLQNKGQSAIGAFSILLPGVEVPNYCNYQSVGSILSLIVSLLPNQKIRGWILCIIISCVEINLLGTGSCWYLAYNVKNKTKGFEIEYTLYCFDSPPHRQDHLWLHYVPQPKKELEMEDGDEVEFSVFTPSNVTETEVKKCGVSLIYEIDNEKDYLSNDQAMIQNASLSYRDAILDKDVSANQAVIDNEGRECATNVTSPTATTGTTGKRKRNDGNKSSTRNRKNSGFLPFFKYVTTEVNDNNTNDDGDKSG